MKQYSEYEPLPGLHINGELTQGENIADIGGVKIAYAALQKALEDPEERKRKSMDSRRNNVSLCHTLPSGNQSSGTRTQNSGSTSTRIRPRNIE